MDSGRDAPRYWTVSGHADELVLQFGRARPAQWIRAFSATDARACASKRGIYQLVSSVTDRAGPKPSDASTAPRNGRRRGQQPSRSLPAATSTCATVMEQFELLGSRDHEVPVNKPSDCAVISVRSVFLEDVDWIDSHRFLSQIVVTTVRLLGLLLS